MITVILAALLIYRSIVSVKRDDQLFLDPAEAGFESEQKQILGKLDRIKPMILVLSVASVGLLVVIIGVWVYLGITGPQ
ncbi:MAG TPA: hypothetical protein VK419_10415 [Bryobacteraceae bacterium]|nr:hypothetical protein [Bryobacteraceae bacterium]